MKFKFALGIVITMIFSVIITIDVLYMPLKLALESSGNFLEPPTPPTQSENFNFFAKLLLIEIVPPIILTVINIIITKSIGKESIEMQTRFVISSFVVFWATPILIVILGRKVSEILQI